jgi:hypothetical protein
VKLIDLDPTWFGSGGEGITDKDGNPVPERHGIGVIFRCPCGTPECWCAVPFKNPLDGKPADPYYQTAWVREGETFETLTLSPSILRSKERGGCGWHGYIKNGEVITC